MTEETTTGVHRLKEMAPGHAAVPRHQRQRLGDKSKFDNLYGCRESLVDAIKRATDVMVAGKIAWSPATATSVRARRAALRALSAQVWVTEIDPINALQAAMEATRS